MRQKQVSCILSHQFFLGTCLTKESQKNIFVKSKTSNRYRTWCNLRLTFSKETRGVLNNIFSRGKRNLKARILEIF